MTKSSLRSAISLMVCFAMLITSFGFSGSFSNYAKATGIEASDIGVPDPILDMAAADNALKFGANNNEFPIGLWTPNNSNYFNENVYKDIAAANFNYVIGSDEIYGGTQMINDALDYADKYHIKMWLNDPNIRWLEADESNKIEAIINSYRYKNAFLGNIFRDEPSISQMESMVPFDKEFKRIAPNTMPMINLLSNAATPEQMGAATWEEYIDTYIRLYEPKYLMYDFYPLIFETQNIGYGLCNSMSIISQKAKEKQIPLWVNIQSIPASLDSPDITGTDLKWQTYMNLALGAKGITYWPYATGRDFAVGTTKPAIIDYYGNKTALYYSAAALNQEVKNIGKILLTLNYKGQMIHSNTIGKQSYELNNFNPISNYSGGNYLIGCFENLRGEKKAMLVNMSRTASTTASLTMNNGSVDYYHLWRNGVRTSKWTSANDVISVDLAPGEGVLLELGPSKPVDLNEKAKNSASNFVSTPYFAPSEYVRSDVSDTVSIKATTAGGTIAMGYHGASYLNESLKVTAKFGGEFSSMSSSLYDAFYLRSQNNGSNLPEGYFSQNKYMFTVNNTGTINLYRVIGGVLTFLSSGTVPAGVNLCDENTYLLCANNLDTQVNITMSVNGTQIISFADISASRITTAGYFGVAANGNNSVITLGKHTTVDLNMNANNSASSFVSTLYYTPSQYIRNDPSGMVSIKGTDPNGTVAMGYHGASYLNENLAFTAKFDGDFSSMSAGVWDAFYLRSQGNGTNLPFGAWSLDKYMFTIKNNNSISLYRVNSQALNYLATVSIPDVDLSSENAFEICASNDADCVNITLKINGVIAIAYSDTAENRITTAGYFGVAAYANSSTMTIGKKLDMVDLNSEAQNNPSLFMSTPYFTATDYVRADVNNTISIKSSADGGVIAMGYHGASFLDENLKITARFGGEFSTMNAGVWDAFYLRSQGNGSNLPVGNFTQDKYMFTIPNSKNIQLHRMNNMVITYLAPSTVPANIDLTAENEYELYAVNYADSVDITLKINGVIVINYNDTSIDRISTAGYFGVAAYANASTITLGRVPPVLFTNYYVSKTNVITNLQLGTTVNNFFTRGNSTISAGVTFSFMSATNNVITGENKVGTGTTIDASTTNNNVKYTIIIYGDVNGDGDVTVVDLAAVKKHLLRVQVLTGAKLIAGDISRNSSISISDLLEVKKQLLNIAFISQT